MAIRYRAGRKSPWQVYWRNPHTGKRQCANFITKDEAEKEESLVKHRLRFDRDSFPDGILPEKPLNTFEAIYLQYLREKQFSKKRLSWQRGVMRSVLRFVGHMPIEEITRPVIDNVMTSMSSGPVKQVTIRSRMSAFQTVLRWAESKDFCGPIAFPKLPVAHYEKLVPPTQEELTAIMLAAPSHIRRVVIIGSQLGVRIGESELFGLTWEDVDLKQCSLRVHGSKKNAALPWREVPMRKSLVAIFMGWWARSYHSL